MSLKVNLRAKIDRLEADNEQAQAYILSLKETIRQREEWIAELIKERNDLKQKLKAWLSD